MLRSAGQRGGSLLSTMTSPITKLNAEEKTSMLKALFRSEFMHISSTELTPAHSFSSAAASATTPTPTARQFISTSLPSLKSWTPPLHRRNSSSLSLRNLPIPESARRVWESLQKPSNLQRAVSLQLEAAWQRHRQTVLGATLVGLSYTTYRVTSPMFGGMSLMSTAVISLSSMAIAVWFYRRHFIITPAAAKMAAMVRLNTHAGALEVFGAPIVSGSESAIVVSGGGVRFKGLRPQMRSKRVAMIFPLKGTERKGLVSVVAKKRRGELRLTLLAVDVPQPEALGGEQRIYIHGGPAVYARGGVLDELRRPLLAALTSEEAEATAEVEEELEEQRRAEVQRELMVLEGGKNDEERKVQGKMAVAREMYSRASKAARSFVEKVQQVSSSAKRPLT